jgi:hypothetical protein
MMQQFNYDFQLNTIYSVSVANDRTDGGIRFYVNGEIRDNPPYIEFFEPQNTTYWAIGSNVPNSDSP